jgi:hypothetical protein
MNDPTFFYRCMKGFTYAAAVTVSSGQVHGLPEWVGPALAVLGGMIKTGDRNPDWIKELTPEDLAQLKELIKK